MADTYLDMAVYSPVPILYGTHSISKCLTLYTVVRATILLQCVYNFGCTEVYQHTSAQEDVST